MPDLQCKNLKTERETAKKLPGDLVAVVRVWRPGPGDWDRLRAVGADASHAGPMGAGVGLGAGGT